MPRQPIERRDNTILQAVLETNKLITEQGKELAINTTETRLLKESVQTLNGKVVGHETRLQTQEGLNALMAQQLQVLKAKEDQSDDFWRENRGKVIWGIIGIILMLFYYLLTHNGFPNFLSK